MNKKKLIRKIALPAAIVFVASVICALSLFLYMRTLYEKRVEELNVHISELTDQNQKYLQDITQTVQEIAEQVPTTELANTQLIQELQSAFLKEHQIPGRAKKYLWMIDTSGEFVFGAPTSVFVRLNSVFDQQKEVLKNTGLFRNRNDFLTKLVDRHHKINFANLNLNSLKRQLGMNSSDILISVPGYRENSRNYSRERAHLLTHPLTNQSGTVLGTLFLKIDDSVNRELYFSKRRVENDSTPAVIGPPFAVLALISGLFLWFLLPTWVYIDAQQRDIRNPAIWSLITIISTIFGLAIYLITRPSAMKSFHCPQCENEVNGGAFCPHCGFDLSSTVCPQCQYPIKPEWSFCPGCRTELREKPELPAEKVENKGKGKKE